MSGLFKGDQIVIGRKPVGNKANSPLSVFPEEVWRIILECLDNSSAELWNVCRVSPMLKRMVLESKKISMFELVLPILIPYLRSRDILQCRLVSKSWENIIDRLLIHNSPGLTNGILIPPFPPPFHDHDLIWNYTPVISISPLASYFSSYPDDHEKVVKKFIRIYEGEHPDNNSFLSSIVRSIDVTYNNELTFRVKNGREVRDRSESYHSKLLRFADLYGEHIHHVKFLFSWDAPSMRPFRFLRKFLIDTPHLKSLDVFFSLSEKVVPMGELPYLPHLEYLCIGQSEDQEVVKAVFVKYCDSAHGSKVLKLGIWADDKFLSDQHILRRVKNLKNLRELKLTNIENGLEVWTLKRFLTGFSWRSTDLKKLTLEFEYIMNDLCPILESLEPISGSLERLKIEFCIDMEPTNITWTNESEKLGSAVRFQNLHTLEITDVPNLVYDFLLMLPQLQYLKIKRSWNYQFLSSEDREMDESLQKRLNDMLDETGTNFPFRKYLYSEVPQKNLFHHPTLWTSLAQLRTINVVNSDADWMSLVKISQKTACFTREGYELEIENNREQSCMN